MFDKQVFSFSAVRTQEVLLRMIYFSSHINLFEYFFTVSAPKFIFTPSEAEPSDALDYNAKSLQKANYIKPHPACPQSPLPAVGSSARGGR
ncbi:MAG: hypothetical protein QTN59_19630 [Candidatus Electrothrix communis]|nr:MAG: hypothetical protein QTN59_19630 [Candidatus Electrothrix communis]